MKKKLPFIIIGTVFVAVIAFIIWQMAHSVSREDVFEEACKEACHGFSSYSADSSGYKVTSYTKGNPSTVVVLNRYKESLKAAEINQDGGIHLASEWETIKQVSK